MRGPPLEALDIEDAATPVIERNDPNSQPCPRPPLHQRIGMAPPAPPPVGT
jgi:hypothetical protein